MAWDDIAAIAPRWMNTSIAIFTDKEAHKAWNWVLEMSAFALTCYNEHLSVDTHKEMMAQPPYQKSECYPKKHPTHSAV